MCYIVFWKECCLFWTAKYIGFVIFPSFVGRTKCKFNWPKMMLHFLHTSVTPCLHTSYIHTLKIVSRRISNRKVRRQAECILHSTKFMFHKFHQILNARVTISVDTLHFKERMLKLSPPIVPILFCSIYTTNFIPFYSTHLLSSETVLSLLSSLPWILST